MIHRSSRPDRSGDPAAADAAASPAKPAAQGRIYSLGIWWLTIGYAAFYAPYSGLVKLTTKGLLPGVDVPPSPLVMLPAIGFATALVVVTVVTAIGWWGYCGCANVATAGGSWRMPRPARGAILGGMATAVIIYTTTLMFTFGGVSIVLALLIMRGGVLVLAPILDLAFARRVRWFAWTGLVLALAAAAINASGLASYELGGLLAVTSGAYLLGYVIRLPAANILAKSNREASCRYFVEEQLVAMTMLVALPLALATLGDTAVARQMREGLSTFLTTRAVWPALGIGALYGALYCFGTLIYLDRRENTFCVALNRSASLLAGVVASFAVSARFGELPPRPQELVGAAAILCAIVVLSPLHHTFESVAARLRAPRSAVEPEAAAPQAEPQLEPAIVAAPVQRKGAWR